MPDIPHSRYRSSIGFVYSIGPGFLEPSDYVWAFPVRLEFSRRGGLQYSKIFSAKLDRSAGTFEALLVCYKSSPCGADRMPLGLLPLPAAHR